MVVAVSPVGLHMFDYLLFLLSIVITFVWAMIVFSIERIVHLTTETAVPIVESTRHVLFKLELIVPDLFSLLHGKIFVCLAHFTHHDFLLSTSFQ